MLTQLKLHRSLWALTGLLTLPAATAGLWRPEITGLRRHEPPQRQFPAFPSPEAAAGVCNGRPLATAHFLPALDRDAAAADELRTAN